MRVHQDPGAGLELRLRKWYRVVIGLGLHERVQRWRMLRRGVWLLRRRPQLEKKILSFPAPTGSTPPAPWGGGGGDPPRRPPPPEPPPLFFSGRPRGQPGLG